MTYFLFFRKKPDIAPRIIPLSAPSPQPDHSAAQPSSPPAVPATVPPPQPKTAPEQRPVVISANISANSPPPVSPPAAASPIQPEGTVVPRATNSTPDAALPTQLNVSASLPVATNNAAAPSTPMPKAAPKEQPLPQIVIIPPDNAPANAQASNELEPIEPIQAALPSPIASPATAQSIDVAVDSLFEANVQAIVDFPEEENAQIKAVQGKLRRTNGVLFPYYAMAGTQLHDTVPVIAKTFQTACSEFNRLYANVSQQPSAEEKIKNIRPLTDAFLREMNLLKGLDNIKAIYNTRYKNQPHDGLEKLNELSKQVETGIKEHADKYHKLTQELLSREPISGEQSSAALSTSILSPQLKSEITTADAAKSLSAYCDKYCPGIYSAQAAEMIKAGQSLLRGIMTDKQKPSTNLEASQKELADITWFLKYCAFKKKQAFYEGTFMIEESGKLNSFLLASPGTGERAASHFIGRSPVNTKLSGYAMKSSLHHGVDVTNGLMPAQKRTILFELIEAFGGDEKPLFFKPENYSPFAMTAYGYDLMMHGWELAESLRKKRFEKGADDLAGMQKERVPDDAKDALQGLIKHIEANNSLYERLLAGLDQKIYNLKEAMNKAKLWGIAYMYAFVSGIENTNDIPQGFQAAAAPLKAIIASLDHPGKRTGREVYITKEEWQKFVFGDLQLS